MPVEARTDTDVPESRIYVGRDDEEDEEQQADLKTWMLEVARGICRLVHKHRVEPVEDPELAHGMALATKPYVDRLLTLRRLLHPVVGIIEKREQIQQLQTDIVADVAQVETLSHDQSLEISPDLAGELQGEIAAIKKDRKIYVRQVDAEDAQPPQPAATRREGLALMDLPIAARLERIFGTRFVHLGSIAELLHGPFEEEERQGYEAILERVWQTIFGSDALRPHVEGNHVKTLQRTFQEYALVFRTPTILAQPDSARLVPCTIESLRRRLGAFFLTGSARTLWYTSLPLYREPIARGHWALVDREYLNCTFKKPSIRLLMYARANELPAKVVRQRSAVEEIYDRVVLETVLRERFFSHCNSLTRTTYQQLGETAKKQVYIFVKDDRIRISGKRGTPHWRPIKPRWPGVLPSIHFED